MMMLFGWELVLGQTLQRFPIPVQCRVQVLIVALELGVVDLSRVLLLLTGLEL